MGRVTRESRCVCLWVSSVCEFEAGALEFLICARASRWMSSWRWAAKDAEGEGGE